MKLLKNMLNIVAIAIEIPSYHTKVNGLAFQVDSTYSKENTNSLNFNEKKNLINRLKYAEHKIFCICVDVYKIYEGGDFKKYIRSFINNKK